MSGKGVDVGLRKIRISTFSKLFRIHMRNGTRPDGRPGELGRVWNIKKLAGEIGVSPRTISNWLNGKTLPVELEPIERAYFDGNPMYDSERRQLRESHFSAMHVRSDPTNVRSEPRALIRTRTGEGRSRAIAHGVKMRRPRKMTPHQIKEALRRRNAGEPHRDIARSYNVSQSTISRLAMHVRSEPRALIRTRTGEGRSRAIARGVKMRRPLKMAPHQIKEALRRRKAGEPHRKIAQSYNVSQSNDFAAWRMRAAARIPGKDARGWAGSLAIASHPLGGMCSELGPLGTDLSLHRTPIDACIPSPAVARR